MKGNKKVKKEIKKQTKKMWGEEFLSNNSYAASTDKNAIGKL